MPATTTLQPENLRNPYGYSEMDWAAQLDPAYAAARDEVRRLSVGEDGALTVKVKECVVLGILASRGVSGAPLPHRLAHWHRHRAGGAKQPHGEEVAHARRAWAEAWMRRARVPA